MLRPKTLVMRRNGLNQLQSGADGSSAFSHGDTFNFSFVGIGSASPTQKVFSGGVDGIVEPLSVGATIPDGSGWLFTNAAHNPTVFSDSTRGKVMYNDYFAGVDIDATKAFNFAAPIGTGVELYSTRLVRSEIKTTGDVDYPTANQLQHKQLRYHASNSISDTNDNTGTELVSFNWLGGSGKQFRVETGDGFITGTATSGGASTLTDTTKNWGVNTLVGRGCQLTGGTGSGQFIKVISNTATTITMQYGWSTVPDATTTYRLESAVHYGAGSDTTINSGWEREEYFLTTNSVGSANGSFVKRVKNAAGVVETIINLPTFNLYSGAGRINYALFQDYFGNNASAITSKKIYTDDIYHSVGTNKRLILTDRIDDLDLATVYETQDYSSWAGDSVTGKINKGKVSSAGNYYICGVSGLKTIIWSQSVQLSGN